MSDPSGKVIVRGGSTFPGLKVSLSRAVPSEDIALVVVEL